MHSTLPCAALAAVALAFASCGGGGDDPTLTRAQYIAKTDELCKSSNTRTRALNVKLRRAAAGAHGDRDVLRRLAPILERGYASVRDNAGAYQAANPPREDAATVERIRAAYDTQAEQVRKLAAAARGGDVARFRALSAEQEQLVRRARRLARGYGFHECGSEKSDPG